MKLTCFYTILLFLFFQSNIAISQQLATQRIPVGLKISVKEEGIYRIYHNDIKDKPIKLHKKENINLYNKGKAIPIFISGKDDEIFKEGDYIEFYGIYNKGEYTHLDPYSPENIYILKETIGSTPLRYKEILNSQSDALITNPKGLFYKTVHFEDDTVSKWNHFETFGKGYRTDFTFWYWIDSIKRAEFKKKFNLPDLTYNEQGFNLRAMVFSRSNVPTDPNHHIKILLNNKKIGDVKFKGITDYKIDISNQPTNILNKDNNIFKCVLPGDLPISNKIETRNGKVLDYVMFDWFEIDYPVKYIAIEDKFYGKISKNNLINDTSTTNSIRLNISGFTEPNIKIFDIENQIFIKPQVNENLIKTNNSNDYSASFRFPINNKSQIYAVSDNAVKHLSQIETVYNYDRSIKKDIMLAIVCYDEFYEPLLKLRDWRNQNGVKTELIRVSDVYNEFNHGIKNPSAIRDYFKFLYNENKGNFKYGLLVGEATKDLRNVTGTARVNRIPAYYYSSEMSIEFADDNYYAKMDDNDHFPDIAVGRLPAGSIKDVENYVDKLIQLETTTKDKEISGWARNVVMITSYEAYLKQKCDAIIQKEINTQNQFNVIKIYAEESTAFQDDSVNKIKEAFDQGAGLLVFIGHGANYIWEAGPTRLKWKNMFSIKDVETLFHPDKYPIILTATCYSGAFDTPADEQSIGMKLINQRKGGAIALFGTADKSQYLVDVTFIDKFFEVLNNNSSKRLGDIFVNAKAQVQSELTLEGMNLLGDPSLDISYLYSKKEGQK